jgi:uncharacterized protein (TIGR00369 family)
MPRPLPPYAELLGLRNERSPEGELVWVMPFGDVVLGRPGFLHGGAIAGLLEFAAFGAAYEAVGAGVSVKPVNVKVDFLRGGIDHDTFATGSVIRLGGRVANVEARAWQQDRAKPIASARMHFLLRRGEDQ